MQGHHKYQFDPDARSSLTPFLQKLTDKQQSSRLCKQAEHALLIRFAEAKPPATSSARTRNHAIISNLRGYQPEGCQPTEDNAAQYAVAKIQPAISTGRAEETPGPAPGSGENGTEPDTYPWSSYRATACLYEEAGLSGYGLDFGAVFVLIATTRKEYRIFVKAGLDAKVALARSQRTVPALETTRF